MKNIMKKIKNRILNFSAGQIIAIGFMLVIMLGAVLLHLPISAKSGGWTNFSDCLLTATSATCITGFVVVDTATYWTLFGQVVILTLIQTGGVGFVTIAVLGSFLVHRRITLKERLVLVEAFNQDHIQGIVNMTRNVLMITFICELAGACLLALRFVPQYGIDGIYKAVFTSISAFCNAGFDVMGAETGKYSSLVSYAGDPLVSYTVCALVITGGLGFFVIRNLYHTRRKTDLSVHTKLAVSVTMLLVALGTAAIFVLEFNNPETIGNLDIGDKITASVFQSVTARTAGFNTIDQTAMTPLSKLVTTVLMFIGGSPGSTAGGVKTVTIAVFIASIVSFIRGKKDINIFRKRVETTTAIKSMVIVSLSLMIIVFSSSVLMATDGLSFLDSLFTCTSALSTVGLAITDVGEMSIVSKYLITLLMYLGRVGSLALIVAMTGKNGDTAAAVRYPKARIIIG